MEGIAPVIRQHWLLEQVELLVEDEIEGAIAAKNAKIGLAKTV
jgi:hypothetical protein